MYHYIHTKYLAIFIISNTYSSISVFVQMTLKEKNKDGIISPNRPQISLLVPTEQLALICIEYDEFFRILTLCISKYIYLSEKTISCFGPNTCVFHS